jgi:hypothetical protein
MGYNRSGKRRTERLKRSKKLTARLVRKAAAQPAGTQPAGTPAKS